MHVCVSYWYPLMQTAKKKKDIQKTFRDAAWQKKKGSLQRQRYLPPNNRTHSMYRLESVSSSGINSSDKRMHKRRRNRRGGDNHEKPKTEGRSGTAGLGGGGGD